MCRCPLVGGVGRRRRRRRRASGARATRLPRPISPHPERRRRLVLLLAGGGRWMQRATLAKPLSRHGLASHEASPLHSMLQRRGRALLPLARADMPAKNHAHSGVRLVQRQRLLARMLMERKTAAGRASGALGDGVVDARVAAAGTLDRTTECSAASARCEDKAALACVTSLASVAVLASPSGMPAAEEGAQRILCRSRGWA